MFLRFMKAGALTPPQIPVSDMSSFYLLLVSYDSIELFQISSGDGRERNPAKALDVCASNAHVHNSILLLWQRHQFCTQGDRHRCVSTLEVCQNLSLLGADAQTGALSQHPTERKSS